MKKYITFLLVFLIMLNTFAFSAAADNTNAAPSVIPAIREWTGTSGNFKPDSNTKLVNISNASSVEKVAGFFKEMLSLELNIAESASGSNEIVFELDKSLENQVGEEGYTLEATETTINIKAATETGLLYGGISVVQSVTADGFFPCGSAVDYPAYPVRSGMLDVGRAWIPLDYVEEITRYMAYFKMNEMHLHINDDGVNGYSAFRLESDVKGLTSTDGYYTKDEYRQYQKDMLEYGVTVITEIDTPFHSSCYAKAENPPPFLPDNYRCLDISKPETLEFVKNLFDEYLTGDDPVFVGKVVHIGTDEYPREYAELMRKYTNDLIEFINSRGYTPRFWGGLGEGGFKGTTPMSDKAQLNFWDIKISGVEETLASNYDFINTVNNVLYTVPTTNYNFPDYYDLKNLYENWQVNIFSITMGDSCEPDDEHLLGACFALWNDLHTAYKGVTKFDIFDRLRGMVCLTAEKTWCGLDTESITYANFEARYNALSRRAGDADPGRHSLPEEGISVDFENGIPEFVTANGEIKDGEFVLDGESFLSFKQRGVGFPNTLEFEITLDKATTAPLFAGDGVEILADCDGNGNFGFKTEFYTFTYDYKLPIGEKVKICLTSDLTTTYLTVNDRFSYAPHNKLNANETVLTTLTVPLSQIGKGVYGTIDNIKLLPVEVDRAKLLANYNIALGAKASVSGLEVNDGRFTADLAVDGKEETRVSFAKDKDEQWLLLDLGDTYDISVLEISFFERVPEYEIYVSENGNDFTKVYSVSDGVEKLKQTDTITLDSPAKARYIKYVQLKRWYAAEWDTYYSGGICELRAYSFNRARYTAIVDEAINFLSTSDKNDPRRKTVRALSNELEAYLDETVLFTGNLEHLYEQLSDALKEPEAPEQSTESTPEETPQNTDGKNKKLFPIIAAAVAGVAIVGAAVIAFVKKKKKK